MGALRCLKQFLGMYSVEHMARDNTVLKQISLVLSLRSRDMDVLVRHETLKRLHNIVSIGGEHEWEYLKMMVDMTQDQMLSVRKSAILLLKEHASNFLNFSTDDTVYMV